jgi:Fe-S cluster biogenesis protein NfuA
MMTRAQIEAVLSRIRPTFQADGSDVELVDLREDCVSIRFSGSCCYCAGVSLMMHTGLSEVLREEIPEFGELRLRWESSSPVIRLTRTARASASPLSRSADRTRSADNVAWSPIEPEWRGSK